MKEQCVFDKGYWKRSRRKRAVCLALGISLAAVITGWLAWGRMLRVQEAVSQTQKDLSREVFRFHILANSDSCPPQVKYESFITIMNVAKKFKWENRGN